MTLSYLNTRILIDGKPIRQYVDDSGKHWVEARDGSIYEIEVKNNSANRVLAVISVDGLNVISGDQAILDPENGYIIDPHSSLKVSGWRTSLEEVKEFIFNFNKQESYSVKLGAGDRNLGVIGVAFYEEKARPVLIWPPVREEHHHHHHHHHGWWYYPYTDTGTWRGGDYTVTCSSTDSSSYTIDGSNLQSSDEPVNVYHSASVDNGPENVLRAQNIDFAAGTSKGDAVESIVTEVEFEAGNLIGTQELYYDSFDNLKKRGIIDVKKKEMPRPFKPSKFCKDI